MNEVILFPPKIHTELEALDLILVRASDVEDFLNKADVVSNPSWPEFMMNDAVANRLWSALNSQHGDFQFALVEKYTKRWIAVGNSIPLSWDDRLENLPDHGWDWALQTGIERQATPNLLCALAIQILPKYRGRGLSGLMVEIMKALGARAGLNQLVAPIRPNLKPLYPLLDMETYLTWKKGNERYDPWLRIHERLGARYLKVCPKAMHISGTVAQWAAWTGLSFQTSGDYIIAGALVPVKIDIEKDIGVYVEPNVWFVHETKPKD